MSAAVTEPNSLPPSPARAVTWIGVAGEARRELLRGLAVAVVAELAVAPHRRGLVDHALASRRSRAHAARGSCGRSRPRPRAGRPCGRASRRPRGARSSFRGLRARSPRPRTGASVDAPRSPTPFSAASTVTPSGSGSASPATGGGASGVGIGADRSARSPRSRPRPLRLRWVTWRTLYGSSAISRATRIARATSRCCWALLPVTRRARIFARSDMKRRSRLTSL